MTSRWGSSSCATTCAAAATDAAGDALMIGLSILRVTSWISYDAPLSACTKGGPVRTGRTLVAATAVALAILTIPAATSAGAGALGGVPYGGASSVNAVIRWNNAALQGIRDAKLGPPMIARALAIIQTCEYDAWAAYDGKAVGTIFGGTLRRPKGERTLANKTEAISFAAYRGAMDLLPGDTALFAALLRSQGYDPNDNSTDIRMPDGIGNVACQGVLNFRHEDGSNQLGDEPGGTPGVPYSDYTGYVCVNKPMDLRAPFDPGTVVNPNRWQQLTYVDKSGNVVTPNFIGPFWGLVTPFAMSSGDQFRSTIKLPKFGSKAYRKQAQQLIDISANLTDEQKVIAEYWADGPGTESPPGHWDLIAQYVSARDGYGNSNKGIDQDVKMFFAMTNAVFEAGIAAWDDKRAYDSVRPITAIRYLFNDQTIRAWGGPYQGTQNINGGAWQPYQPSWFPTPPFPEYLSGHSTFSMAAATILREFTGSDTYGGSITVKAGSSFVEPGLTPAQNVTLTWPTFTDAAEQAGISRLYGGIHFMAANLDGRALGERVALQAWLKALSYFDGSA